MWERAGLVSVDCFGEVDDTAKYAVVFALLFPHWFLSVCAFDLGVHVVFIAVLVVWSDVVDSCGAYPLSLPSNVSLDCFIRVGEIPLDQSRGQFGPCRIVAMSDCFDESFFWWKSGRCVVP